MMELSFEKLLVRLTEAEVRFLLVGGLAVALNGYVRLTEDVDILVEDSPTNLESLLGALAGFGEGFAAELEVADFTPEEGAIRVIEDTEDCVIDIFTVMGGKRFAELSADATRHEIAGKGVLVASRKVLIGLKERSVREKDQLDVLALRRLMEEGGEVAGGKVEG